MKNRFTSLSTAAALLAMTLALTLTAPSAEAKRGTSKSIVAPTVTSLSIVNGQVVAGGTATFMLRGQPITATFSGVAVDISLASDRPAASCPSLDVRLAPVNLSLLGLVIQSGPACFTITAPSTPTTSTNATALGNLFCHVANLLNAGLTFDQILAGNGTATVPGLTSGEINSFRAQLTGILNSALANIGQAVVTTITPVSTHNTCAIVRLELNSSNVTMPGLNVVADNCAGGALTVDVTSVTGTTNLLGNILCGLVQGNLIHSGESLQDIVNQILGGRR